MSAEKLSRDCREHLAEERGQFQDRLKGDNGRSIMPGEGRWSFVSSHDADLQEWIQGMCFKKWPNLCTIPPR